MDYAQTLDNIRRSGLDSKKTPFTAFTVYAPEDGEYDIVARIRCGIYGPNASSLHGLMAHITVIANADEQTMKVIDFPILQDKKDWFVRETVKLRLKKGENKIYLTALTGDLTDADGKSVLWNEIEEAFLWIDHDYIAVPKALTSDTVGGRIEAEHSLYAYYTNNLFSTSGGFVGLRDEGNTNNSITYDITYDNLNADSMSLVHMVHYKVEAPEDGLYDVTIAVRAVDVYGDSEVNIDEVVGFVAVMVNQSDKYKVEFHVGYKAVYTQFRLKKGINTISVSGPLREMLSNSLEPKNVVLRIDQDFIDLGPRLAPYDEGKFNTGEDDDIATPLIRPAKGETKTEGGDSIAEEGSKSVETGYSGVLPAALGVVATSGAALASTMCKRRKNGKHKDETL